MLYSIKWKYYLAQAGGKKKRSRSRSRKTRRVVRRTTRKVPRKVSRKVSRSKRSRSKSRGKRKLSGYQKHMGVYLRKHMRTGLSKAERKRIFKDAVAAWHARK